jgi:NADPH:quinone reductase-like Zn-dependent oxidoreductase
MRAIVTRQPGGLDKLELVDLPEPGAPGTGEILVRLRASSLNYHDYAVATRGLAQDGRILMSDGAGEVLALGEGVSEFAVGDRVVSTFFPTWIDGPGRRDGMATVPGDGVDGYARELAVMPATGFTRAPAGYSHAEAAALTCAGVTAWRALVPHGPVSPGESVLVMGTGGVSIFALQLAKAMGATVIATSSSDEKLERLKALGADHLVNYRTTKNWGRKVFEISDGGVDHVVEVGGPGTLDESIEATRLQGHIALIGVLTGFQGPVRTAVLMTRQIRLQGVIVGSRRDQLDLVRAVEATGVKPVIDRHFPLEALADAFRHQESGRHFGKISVDI